ncbi:MAG: hypothetical protein J5680_04895, partial [Neisseriaceae bacterium]|nr:hypothetical protein [Neisseriaceae bacterium]
IHCFYYQNKHALAISVGVNLRGKCGMQSSQNAFISIKREKKLYYYLIFIKIDKRYFLYLS